MSSSTDKPAATFSFEQAYEDHVDMVWRALRRLGVRDAQLEDAVQEVFLAAFRNQSSFEGRSTIATWLYGIALHVARNQRRHLRRHPVASEAGVQALEQQPAAGSSPESEVLGREANRVIIELLDTLDDDKREVFVLAELEDLSAPEIASVLGQNVNTVYARLRRARADFDGAIARYHAAHSWRFGS